MFAWVDGVAEDAEDRDEEVLDVASVLEVEAVLDVGAVLVEEPVLVDEPVLLAEVESDVVLWELAVSWAADSL